MNIFEEICTDHLQELATIAGGPFVLRPEEERRLRAEALTAFESRYSAAIAAACALVVEDIDRRIGDLERSARSATSMDIELRAQRLARQASDATDEKGFSDAVDEAHLVGHDDTTRGVLAAVENRFGTLTAKSSTPERLRQARQAFQLAAMQWRREHPTTSEQIAKLRSDREKAIADVEREAAHVRQMNITRDRQRVIGERHAQIKL